MKNDAKQRAAAASAKVRGTRSFSRFKDRLNEMGATLVETEWLGARTKHRVVCSEGHECTPLPNNVISGFGPCKICAGTSPDVSEKKFRERLGELGAVLVEDDWKGRHTPHRVICSEGHECTPTPGNVLMGGGLCRECAWKWDVFYVVASPDVVKFGVTTGDPRPRLNVHSRDGLTERVFVATGLPEGVALEVEGELKKLLSLSGVRPVRGHEYFPAAVRNMVVATAKGMVSVNRWDDTRHGEG